MTVGESWGRYPRAKQEIIKWGPAAPNFGQGKSWLPYGLGRSYGDVCLNDGGQILVTTARTGVLAFDTKTGIIKAESGLSLAALLEIAVPENWFIPVTPGTKFVTLGGAVANDVHGKNHHSGGTFGRHVLRFGLLRSDGHEIECSAHQHADLYEATIAGLGLTGLITWVELKLKKIAGPLILSRTTKFRNLEEFFEISAGASQDFEYTVSWLDCVSGGSKLGRGIFIAGNHAESPLRGRHRVPTPLVGVPISAPEWILNPWSMRLFNFLYYNKQLRREEQQLGHYIPFFYPLDGVGNWNRLYGRRGFFQFQCVIPDRDKRKVLSELLRIIVASKQASFLAVLKEFGDVGSPGLMSFPRQGVTLCLDFANRGERTLALLKQLDTFVREAQGAIYPAKDATMAGENFKRYFPQYEQFGKLIDPRFSSSFYRRVIL